ncbi:LOW QUALITY PROTEIN: E3 ubiquitin-protein ligase TRIM11-like [Sarcophilus harrisii]|uniref:LOW QUALITY PROTEIN: E3 ubiquitin-protein ligase TRIM11-like n=1 Tax=Sarcophilus harrisii TaxID=9305 RepID=UPI001301AE7B|nr:LOW QUALITY PROTEIN: E3 ubiquitin-protein ligase TRIM11-like [Sarcophilus harrisii]
MAASDPVRLLQEEVTCAVCLDYLHEPVTIDCGHNFCRACITRCWDEMGRRFPCPQCRARSPKRKLRPNCQLGPWPGARPAPGRGAQAGRRGPGGRPGGRRRGPEEEEAKGAPQAGRGPRREDEAGRGPGSPPAASPGDSAQWAEPRPGVSLPQSPCPQHPGEELWLFCRRDGATLCPACHPERAHQGHDLVVLAEEGRATRARLRGALGRLRAQREALEDAGLRQERQVAHLGQEAAIRRQRLGDEFEGLRHFLSQAEQDLLGSLAAASTRPRPPAAPAGRASRPTPGAWTLLLEASAWLHLPSARLLGDSSVQEGLRKLEAEAGKTLGARVLPGEGLGGAGRAQAVLKEAARAFRERLSGELERDDPPVRFDINSAAPGLEVSEGGRTVRLGPRASAQQADLCPCVLGDKAWGHGSHYWEVDVSQSGGWAVGVACEGNPRPQPNKGLWALQLSRGQLWTPEVTLAIRHQPQRLAVYLEVEAGLLAFSEKAGPTSGGGPPYPGLGFGGTPNPQSQIKSADCHRPLFGPGTQAKPPFPLIGHVGRPPVAGSGPPAFPERRRSARKGSGSLPGPNPVRGREGGSTEGCGEEEVGGQEQTPPEPPRLEGKPGRRPGNKEERGGWAQGRRALAGTEAGQVPARPAKQR